jgi:hypothetical protein
MPAELRITVDLFFPFLEILSVLVYAHVNVGVFTSLRLFFLSCLVSSNYSADGALAECLAVFPRHKGRTNLSLVFLGDYMAVLIVNRYIVTSTIIPELCRWLELSSPVVFVDSVRFFVLLKKN